MKPLNREDVKCISKLIDTFSKLPPNIMCQEAVETSDINRAISPYRKCYILWLTENISVEKSYFPLETFLINKIKFMK